MERPSLRKLLLACVIVLAACSNNAPPSDPDLCGGRCDSTDSPAQQIAPLMEQAHERPGSFNVARDQEDRWFLEALGQSGERLLESNALSDASSAYNAALSIEENGVLPERYRVVQDEDGNYRFELLAGNNRAIARGRSFRDQAQAEADAQSARDFIAGMVQYKTATQGGARFDLSRDPDDGTWSFRLLDETGRVLLESQVYQGRSDAVTGILSVRENGKDEDAYRVIEDNAVVLRAGNNREIARSAEFDDEGSAYAAIEAMAALLLSEKVGNPW